MRLWRNMLHGIVGVCTVLLPLAAQAAAASGQPMYVQVRSSKIRSAPEFWAAAVSGVSYGDRVTVVPGQKSESGWLKVKAAGKEGFLHISALTSRKVVLRGSGEQSPRAADASEVVLAGKGFSKEIEADYARTHALSYAAVDQVERTRVSDGALAAFIKAGKLGAH